MICCVSLECLRSRCFPGLHYAQELALALPGCALVHDPYALPGRSCPVNSPMSNVEKRGCCQRRRQLPAGRLDRHRCNRQSAGIGRLLLDCVDHELCPAFTIWKLVGSSGFLSHGNLFVGSEFSLLLSSMSSLAVAVSATQSLLVVPPVKGFRAKVLCETRTDRMFHGKLEHHPLCAGQIQWSPAACGMTRRC